MRNNSIWNLITKVSSFLAIIFLLAGAGFVCASFFAGSDHKFAVVSTVVFSAVFGIFSLVATNLSEIKLKSERNEAL